MQTTVTPAVTPTNVITGTKAPYKMRPGDPIVIFLRDLPGAKSDMQLEDIIDDQGAINLPYIGRMTAAGKTTSVFEQEIEQKYIDEKIYKIRITANVVVPQQFIFVTGEVKLSNKYPLVSGMTLLQAITTAGGPTDYADLKKVELSRNGAKTIYNVTDIRNNPSKDIPLEPGDQINVPRGWY